MKTTLLGSTEQKIMACFWQAQRELSIAEIHRHLSKKEPVAYTTVATIVGRLVGKNLLIRHKSGRGYVYRCLQTKNELMASRSRGLIKTLFGNFGDVAIAGLVEELKANPQALQKLRELTSESE